MHPADRVTIPIDAHTSQAFNSSMRPGVTSQTKLALDELDDYLSSDVSPEYCMQLSDLDGFLTGIAVSPELIQPSEWLPVIWGNDFPDFENDDMAELIFETIMGRYNEILQSLAADPPQFNPIFWEANDGVAFAGDWAEGFRAAMMLRPVDWAEILNDEDAVLPLVPIIVLLDAEEKDPVPVSGADRRIQFFVNSANLIPSSVIEIDAYWKARRGAAPKRSGTLH